MIQWNPSKVCLEFGNSKCLFLIDSRTNTFTSTEDNVAQRLWYPTSEASVQSQGFMSSAAGRWPVVRVLGRQA